MVSALITGTCYPMNGESNGQGTGKSSDWGYSHSGLLGSSYVKYSIFMVWMISDM